nr:TPA_asm: PD protein [Pecan associated jivivirus 1]
MVYGESCLALYGRCVSMQSAAVRSANSASSSGSRSPSAGAGLTGTRLESIRKVDTWRSVGDTVRRVVPDGMCYGKLLNAASRESVMTRCGEWPTFGSLVRLSGKNFLPLDGLRKFKIVENGAGSYHVKSGGRDGAGFLEAVATYARKVQVQPGTLAAKVSELFPHDVPALPFEVKGAVRVGGMNGHLAVFQTIFPRLQFDVKFRPNLIKVQRFVAVDCRLVDPSKVCLVHFDFDYRFLGISISDRSVDYSRLAETIVYSPLQVDKHFDYFSQILKFQFARTKGFASVCLYGDAAFLLASSFSLPLSQVSSAAVVPVLLDVKSGGLNTVVIDGTGCSFVFAVSKATGRVEGFLLASSGLSDSRAFSVMKAAGNAHAGLATWYKFRDFELPGFSVQPRPAKLTNPMDYVKSFSGWGRTVDMDCLEFSRYHQIQHLVLRA